MAQDVFAAKNQLVDKTGEFLEMFEDAMGSSFLFSKSDEECASKRKACAHAFYKDRLEKMMGVLKDKLRSMMTTWNEEIEANPDKQATIDMAIVFEKLFCSNIVHTAFGEDVSDMPIEIDYMTKVGGAELVRKTVTLPEAIHEFDKSIMAVAPFKWLNPVYRIARKLTGIKNFTKYQQKIADNGLRTREAILEYVRERKSGKRKS